MIGNAGRFGATVVLAIGLAACSDPMTSYEGEKGRIRSALPPEIRCTETAGLLQCSGNGLEVSLHVSPVSRNAPEVGIIYREFVTRQPALISLMKAYGVSESDLDNCQSRKDMRFERKGYVVHCSTSRVATFTFRIVRSV